jgi:hypothetical protein
MDQDAKRPFDDVDARRDDHRRDWNISHWLLGDHQQLEVDVAP